jgi:hypothetical protein
MNMEPAAAGLERQTGVATAEMTYDETPWDVPAHPPGTEAGDPIFAFLDFVSGGARRHRGGPCSSSWMVIDVDRADSRR